MYYSKFTEADMSTILKKEAKKVMSLMPDEEEREEFLWNEVFRKLSYADGKRDNLIDRVALVKLIWQLELNERIEFESKLDLPLEKVERLLKEVCF